MSRSNDALVIPLWIDGHAFLTVTRDFCDVRHAASGDVLRRTPLAGADEAQAAADAARRAQPAWAALTPAERAAQLAAAGDALAGYAQHFAGLLAEEAGLAEPAAVADVAAAVATLREAAPADSAPPAIAVLAMLADQRAGLAAPLARVLPALLAGSTLVLRPSPRAPSALYALAEVLAEAGLPGGICNIVHGEEALVEGLCATTAVDAVACIGDDDFVARVGAIAARHGRTLA